MNLVCDEEAYDDIFWFLLCTSLSNAEVATLVVNDRGCNLVAEGMKDETREMSEGKKYIIVAQVNGCFIFF